MLRKLKPAAVWTNGELLEDRKSKRNRRAEVGQ